MANGQHSERLNYYLGKCIDDGGCLVWQGRATDSGAPVGTVVVGGNSVSLRRALYESSHGKKLAKNVVVSMSCGCSLCLNVEHMKLSSRKTIMYKNLIAMTPVQKANSAKRLTAHSTKLCWDDVDTIRSLDLSNQAIASMFGVTKEAIRRVRNYTTWTSRPLNPFAGLMK